MSGWREYFAQAQRALPRTATKAQRMEATRRAAAEYQSKKGGSVATRSNPTINKDLVKLGIVVAAVYIGLMMIQGQQQPASTEPPKWYPTQHGM